MKPSIAIIAAGAAIIASSCVNTEIQPRFSTFSDHYISVMQQDGSSLKEAAEWMKTIGITGVDARTSLTDEQMGEFLAAGIEPACAILDLSWSNQTPEEMLQMEDQAIEFCKKYGCNTLMYCPYLVPENAPESVRDSLLQSVKRFADKVVNAGLDLTFEDYDNPRSLTFNTADLDKLFELIPAANHTYDSGNFIFAGDDAMEAFNHFKTRISHVHLKDRYAVGDHASPAVGTGIAPCREVIDLLMADGYKGWFTIEGYGAEDMKAHLSLSMSLMTK